MKKTYINPETEVTRIAPIVMAAESLTINKDHQGIDVDGAGVETYGKDDNCRESEPLGLNDSSNHRSKETGSKGDSQCSPPPWN